VEFAAHRLSVLRIFLGALIIGMDIIDQSVVNFSYYSKKEAQDRVMHLGSLMVEKKPLGYVFVYMPVIKYDSLY
jgi:hypothetical protein